MDRDATFSRSIRDFVSNEGVKPVRSPPRNSNLNARLERFFGSLKSEYVYTLTLFGKTTMRRTARTFITHYLTLENHQGLENRLVAPKPHRTDTDKKIETTEHLGSLPRSYRQAA